MLDRNASDSTGTIDAEIIRIISRAPADSISTREVYETLFPTGKVQWESFIETLTRLTQSGLLEATDSKPISVTSLRIANGAHLSAALSGNKPKVSRRRPVTVKPTQAPASPEPVEVALPLAGDTAKAVGPMEEVASLTDLQGAAREQSSEDDDDAVLTKGVLRMSVLDVATGEIESGILAALKRTNKELGTGALYDLISETEEAPWYSFQESLRRLEVSGLIELVGAQYASKHWRLKNPSADTESEAADVQVPQAVTLRQVWADYQLSRKLAARTVDNYNRRLKAHLSDWLDRPIASITKDEVEQRHRRISEKASTSANSTMKTLRALIYYAQVKYENADGAPIVKYNAVSRLTEVRGWNKEHRRTTVILQQQWRPLFRGIYEIQNATMRDLVLFITLTGLRKSEARSLRWEDVDLKAGIAVIKNTKNGDDFTLPLNDFCWRILQSRSVGSERSPWVFPGKKPGEPVAPGTKFMERLVEKCGFQWTLHDLRRSWITMADELDMRTEVIKALVNHRSEDVTEGYTIRSVERLRRASQKICDAIMTRAGFIRREPWETTKDVMQRIEKPSQSTPVTGIPMRF